MERISLVHILQIALFAKGVLNSDVKFIVSQQDSNGPGSPLFLTPYIENNKIDEARDLSRVNFTGFPEVRSYAGFFTIDKKYDSNHFLWYFPARSYIQEQVVILWLQGGPGKSSLIGLFGENGPLQIKNGTFHEREIHWAKHHHLIYIDNPVGTGFSFTNDSRGYCTNQTQIGEHLYETLIQFFQLFPELQKTKLFLGGESYACKFLSALGYTIHEKNPTAKIKVNLKGFMIGDGWCDPINQLVYSDYLYQIGLMDWKQKKETEVFQNQIIELIKNEAWLDASNTAKELNNYICDCIGNISMYNYLPSELKFDDEVFLDLVQSVPVRRAIHVGNLTFNDGKLVCSYLAKDLMKSVAPWISELLDHYHMLFYIGQTDIIVPYPSTVNFLRNLNFSANAEYLEAKRMIVNLVLYDSTEEIGFLKSAGKLTEVLIRGAGHMVPMDKPEWNYNLMIWWRLHIGNKAADGEEIVFI